MTDVHFPDAIRGDSTWLVTDMSRLLSPFIALLDNKSLTTDCFPAEFIVHRTVAAEGDGLDLHASF